MVSRFNLYVLSSTALFSGVLAYAWQTRQQFYPAVIYLVTSKFSVMVLGNMALVFTLLLGRFTKSLFLGSLRDAEVEILYENSRFAITETCLALTIFREEINVRVVALFTGLLFAKIFHWLCQSRVEHIEQAENVTRVTHFRIVSLMSVLAAMDTALVIFCSYLTYMNGPSVLILFGFEFLVLLITLVAIFSRYILHLIDLRVEGTWHNKAAFFFYIELGAEILRLFVYLIFFLIIFSYYGLPLHIVRDLWVSIRNLERRLSAYFRYRRLTANMNERFPDATPAELDETDRVCIICREEMHPGAKKLPCGHIFHFYCLRMWLQRQQTCPTCRADIPSDGPAVPNSRPGAGAPAVVNGNAVPPQGPPGPAQAAAQPAGPPLAAPQGNNAQGGVRAGLAMGGAWAASGQAPDTRPRPGTNGTTVGGGTTSASTARPLRHGVARTPPVPTPAYGGSQASPAPSVSSQSGTSSGPTRATSRIPSQSRLLNLPSDPATTSVPNQVDIAAGSSEPYTSAQSGGSAPMSDSDPLPSAAGAAAHQLPHQPPFVPPFMFPSAAFQVPAQAPGEPSHFPPGGFPWPSWGPGLFGLPAGDPNSLPFPPVPGAGPNVHNPGLPFPYPPNMVPGVFPGVPGFPFMLPPGFPPLPPGLGFGSLPVGVPPTGVPPYWAPPGGFPPMSTMGFPPMFGVPPFAFSAPPQPTDSGNLGAAGYFPFTVPNPLGGMPGMDFLDPASVPNNTAGSGNLFASTGHAAEDISALRNAAQGLSPSGAPAQPAPVATTGDRESRDMTLSQLRAKSERYKEEIARLLRVMQENNYQLSHERDTSTTGGEPGPTDVFSEDPPTFHDSPSAHAAPLSSDINPQNTLVPTFGGNIPRDAALSDTETQAVAEEPLPSLQPDFAVPNASIISKSSPSSILTETEREIPKASKVATSESSDSQTVPANSRQEELRRRYIERFDRQKSGDSRDDVGGSNEEK